MIKILFVEDNDLKYSDVAAALSAETAGEDGRLHRATNYLEAADALRDNHYDLVILDIRLPYAAGRPPKREVSEDIVAMINNGGAVSPSYIIGLTEYSEETVGGDSYPLEYFYIEHYSSTDRSWLPRLQRHIRQIVSSKASARSLHYNSFDYDVLVICARASNEASVIDKAMKWEEGTVRDVTFFGSASCKTGTWNVRGTTAQKTALLCLERTGLSSAAALTSAAIAYFRPRVVTMLGMCCGLNHEKSTDKQSLGDVLIVSETSCWDEGRYSEEESSAEDMTFFEARPAPGHASDAFRRLSESMLENDAAQIEGYLARRYATKKFSDPIVAAGKVVPAKPKIRLGLNVSGSSVVAATEQSGEIMVRFPSALGLEMECHAIYTACYLSPGLSPESICVKGVADFGDGKKAKEHQKLATYGSYLVFEELLVRYLKGKHGAS